MVSFNHFKIIFALKFFNSFYLYRIVAQYFPQGMTTSSNNCSQANKLSKLFKATFQRIHYPNISGDCVENTRNFTSNKKPYKKKNQAIKLFIYQVF